MTTGPTALEINPRAAACARMGLGTAQFGLDYGITNATGRVRDDEVRGILAIAAANGIGMLDCAASYGEAEKVIGRLAPGIGTFRIVTKTPTVNASEVTAEDVSRFDAALDQSLENLGRSSVDGLLLHRAGDLAKRGGDRLTRFLIEARDSGRAERIGVSVYSGTEIDAVLEQLRPDIVQVPISVADQRLIESGHLARLNAFGIEVHGRSVFLQGVLLAASGSLPSEFEPARDRLEALGRAASANGLSRLEACLSFVLQQANIDVVIVGVARAAELDEVVAATVSVADRAVDGAGLGIDDERIVDPRNWPHR